MKKTIKFSKIESVTYEFTVSEIVTALLKKHDPTRIGTPQVEWIYPDTNDPEDYSEPDPPVGMRCVFHAAAEGEPPAGPGVKA